MGQVWLLYVPAQTHARASRRTCPIRSSDEDAHLLEALAQVRQFFPRYLQQPRRLVFIMHAPY